MKPAPQMLADPPATASVAATAIAVETTDSSVGGAELSRARAGKRRRRRRRHVRLDHLVDAVGAVAPDEQQRRVLHRRLDNNSARNSDAIVVFVPSASGQTSNPNQSLTQKTTYANVVSFLTLERPTAQKSSSLQMSEQVPSGFSGADATAAP